jgi:protein-S-isoprenylcysteine O-methyltransferase Ste14
MTRVRVARYIALVVFFLDLPVPVYWLILHPLADFWRQRVRAAFWIAGLGAWTFGGIFVVFARNRLIAPGAPSVAMIVAGFLLIGADVLLLMRADRDLGHSKLVGHAELTGKVELSLRGMYSHVRHPRYTGMIAAVMGACVLAGSLWAWECFAVWFALVMISILLEEREMRRRFGEVYEEYCRRVPRFLPFPWRK